MENVDPGADVVQFVGNAALEASGLGFATEIWDSFFPQGDPVFSSAQIQQLTDLFKELFAAQYYLENLDNFMSTTKLCDEYANNPTPGLLAAIMVQSANTAEGILSNGYVTAQVFLSAASLHVLTLKFALEAATDPNKPGAEKNLAQGALSTLNSLLELELQYGAAQGWQEFAAFKQATVLNNGSMSQAAIAAFGDTYVKQVQELMGLVALYAPEKMVSLRRACVSVPQGASRLGAGVERWCLR
ncbi:hypothetical protein HV824_23230 [Myxococcus sp. AM009]|uniref:hypothetical protein n=1 Tax=Myxococcus sp. AM009 TaxID=2745137 RepID=UPI001595AA6E|nr:hypothetical protein [Myxococcus sp. AM009]NVJ01010.1 hypothetical protein [Myxococcus sp. AM009]